MATQQVEIVARNPDIVGENPLWDPDDRRLYWTDNRSQRVHRLDPATGAVETVVEGQSFYAFTLQADGSLLLFMDRTRVGAAQAGGPVRLVIDGLPGEREARFNDVVADRSGRVVAGVIPPEGGTGSLYSIGQDGSAALLASGLEMPNGMAFSPDDRLLYVAETRGRRIALFDYDLDSGTVSNRRVSIDLSGGEGGSPDGITLDADGCLWVALAGGWSVVRYDSSGTEMTRVEFPARKITSIGFGEDDLSTAYVTSSSRQSVPGEEIGPEGGALFAFRPGVAGVPEHRSSVSTEGGLPIR